MSNKSSIYVAEVELKEAVKKYSAPSRDDIDSMPSWYHCFLVLVDEAYGSFNDARIIQQLHFNNRGGGMVPMVVSGDNGPEWKESLHLFPQLSGDDICIVSQWNRMLDYAVQIKNNPVPFGAGFKFSDMAINCRQGVASALKVSGISLSDDYVMATAGMRAAGMPEANSSEINLNQNFVALQCRRQELSAKLPYIRYIR